MSVLRTPNRHDARPTPPGDPDPRTLPGFCIDCGEPYQSWAHLACPRCRALEAGLARIEGRRGEAR